MSAPMADKPHDRRLLAGLRRDWKSVVTLLVFVAYAGAVFWNS